MQDRADTLTRDIHAALDENLIDRQLLERYLEDPGPDAEPSLRDVRNLYASAGAALPHSVVRTLEEVQEFHRLITINRRDFLADEVRALRERIAARAQEIQRLDDERSEVLSILETHTAPEERVRLKERHATAVAKVQVLTDEIHAVDRALGRETALNEALRDARHRGAQSIAAQQEVVDRVAEVFAQNVRFLYDRHGVLSLSFGERGLRVNVGIPKDLGEGVGKMRTFCYDLTLAQLRAESGAASPGFLVHDSGFFSGVEPRQVASAIVLAEKVARENGSQYIMTMNSHEIPTTELRTHYPGFDLTPFVNPVVLTDDTAEGRLLGIEF